MVWLWVSNVVILVVGGIAAIGMALRTWRDRHLRTPREASVLLLAAAVWALAHALELTSASLAAKLFWDNVQILGAAAAPVAWSAFVLRYIWRERGLTRRSIALLSVVPLASVLLAFTNGLHGLYWSRVTLNTAGPFPMLEQSNGIGFLVFATYVYALMLVATLLLARALTRFPSTRRRVGGLLFVAFVPGLASVVEVLGLSPIQFFQPTPHVVVLTSLIVVWSFARLQRRDLVSGSGEMALQSIGDGVIILDKWDWIVDINRAAQRMIGCDHTKAVKQPVSQVWPVWRERAEGPGSENEGGGEVVVGSGSGERVYDVRVTPLVDWRDQLASRVVVLRDITERRRTAEALRRERDLAEALGEAAIVVSGTLDLDRVLDRILEQVNRVVPADAANVMLLDGDRAQVVRQRGYERVAGQEAPTLAVLDVCEVATLRQMIETGEPLVVRDTATDPRWVDRPGYEWLRSYAAAPITVRGQVIGFLNVDSSATGFFTSAHADALRAFAGHAAVAIENARLYQQAQSEITERMQAEEWVRASLNEKEVLLREIHHRVKNNLQIVCSLLSLQAANVVEQDALDVLHESENRVRSMALVHERLYRSPDLAHVDFARYARGLVDHLLRSYRGPTDHVTLEVDVEDVPLAVDLAIPCGLILNELISNALKHAFPDGKRGEIRVEFHADHDEQYVLAVSDDGVGFPGELDPHGTDSLGLQLVNMLAGQVAGTLDLDRSEGTAFKVVFAKEMRMSHGAPGSSPA